MTNEGRIPVWLPGVLYPVTEEAKENLEQAIMKMVEAVSTHPSAERAAIASGVELVQSADGQYGMSADGPLEVLDFQLHCWDMPELKIIIESFGLAVYSYDS